MIDHFIFVDLPKSTKTYLKLDDLKDTMSFQLSFVTYNISGANNYNLEKRLESFLNLVKSNPPDVLVVQECTRMCYEKLLREMGLLGYKRQILEVMNHRSCGELIFSKYPIEAGQFIPFRKTSENRGVSLLKITAWLEKNIPDLWICTSQFDSTSAMCRMQIKDLAYTLKTIPLQDNVIFGGDTRILEYQSDLKEPETWHDSWYEAGNDSGKYTYNHETNLLVDPPYKDRPDRVWYRSITNNMRCVECELYGNEEVPTISSHYGVKCVFEIDLDEDNGEK